MFELVGKRFAPGFYFSALKSLIGQALILLLFHNSGSVIICFLASSSVFPLPGYADPLPCVTGINL
jgi:hypothetical protein